MKRPRPGRLAGIESRDGHGHWAESQNPDLQSVRIIREVSGWYEKCPDDLQSIRIICLNDMKGVHQGDLESVRNPDDPKSVQIIWKVYGWCAKCLDDPKCFPMIWKMSRLYVKCVLVWAYFAKHIFRQWWCHHHDHHDHHDHHHDYHQCKWVEEQSG